MNIKEYIHKCDADFRERLYDVADAVSRSFDETDKDEKPIRIVCLSGPTCSGKTTAAQMIAERLKLCGKRLHIISIDDFYFDREYLHKLSEYKGIDGIDYDSIDTIDLPALERFVSEALSGESAEYPSFNFKTGNRDGYKTIASGENDVFLFEGIQAIYPEVCELFEPHGFVSIYIAPQTPIAHGETVFLPDEIRFMRRIVRDNNFRNSSAEFTMHLWESVRRNEEKHIFPYVNGCKYRIDSTHMYEIGVLKPYLERLLSTVSTDSEYYGEATAMLKKISNVEKIDSRLIDEASLYKEFV